MGTKRTLGGHIRQKKEDIERIKSEIRTYTRALAETQEYLARAQEHLVLEEAWLAKMQEEHAAQKAAAT